MTPTKCIGRKVEAVLLRHDNAAAVAEWCGGRVLAVGPVAIMVDCLRIPVGEYVVRGADGKHYGLPQPWFAAMFGLDETPEPEPVDEAPEAGVPEGAPPPIAPADLDTLAARNVVSDLLCARIRAGMTVDDVADAMGVTVRFVRRFEGDPRLSTIQRYAAAVGADLFGPMVVGPVHEVKP